MTKEQINNLIAAHEAYLPSKYEERYVRWAAISYDKDTLGNFLNQLQYLREDNEADRKYRKLLEDILAEHDYGDLMGLLNGDEEVERKAAIEKYARAAALDMATEGKFTYPVLEIITNFPQADYVLVLKRCQELVALISNVSTQATTLLEGVPGA